MSVGDRLQGLGQRAWAHRPHWKATLKSLPFLAFGIALLVFMVRNWDTVELPQYSTPEGFVLDPPATTQPADAERPALMGAVAGSTTSIIPANSGTSRLFGTVVGPGGPAANATVRIERAIGGEIQTFDAFTDGLGQWDAQGLGGGRYRVRAYLPPTLAQPTAEVFLLGSGEARELALTMNQYSEPSIAIGMAPDPAELHQQVNVVVQVTGRFVGPDGFVTIQPLIGGLVEVTTSFGFERNTDDEPLITDQDGHVVVNYQCESAGAVQLTASVRTTPQSPPVTAQKVVECIDPLSTTTTTVPGSESSTTTTVP